MEKMIILLQATVLLVVFTCSSALSKAPDSGAMVHDDDLRSLNMKSTPEPQEPPTQVLNNLSLEEDPIFEVVRNDDVNFLLILVKGGHDVNVREKEKNRTPLMVVRSWATAATLIKLGANVKSIDTDGWTPLHHAVFAPQAKLIMELFVEKGADINARNNLGDTPLATCIPPNKTELVELLLKLGADQSIPDYSGSTPLDTKYALGHRYIVQTLER